MQSHSELDGVLAPGLARRKRKTRTICWKFHRYRRCAVCGTRRKLRHILAKWRRSRTPIRRGAYLRRIGYAKSETPRAVQRLAETRGVLRTPRASLAPRSPPFETGSRVFVVYTFGGEKFRSICTSFLLLFFFLLLLARFVFHHRHYFSV